MSARQHAECEGQFKGKKKQRPLLISLIILLRGKWSPKEEMDRPPRNFPASSRKMKHKVFLYQHWKDHFVFMSPGIGDSLQSLERHILEIKWRFPFFVFAAWRFHGLTLLSLRLGHRREHCWCFYVLELIFCSRVWRGQMEPMDQCPLSTKCFAWALGIMNTIHWMKKEKE